MSAAYQAKHRAAGLCLNCVSPAEQGYSFCAQHMEKARIYQRNRRVIRNAAGMCETCNRRKKLATSALCRFCRKRNRAHHREWIAANTILKRLCRRCQRRLRVDGADTCGTCVR